MSGWNNFVEKDMVGTLRYGQNRYKEMSRVEGEETKATGSKPED